MAFIATYNPFCKPSSAHEVGDTLNGEMSSRRFFDVTPHFVPFHHKEVCFLSDFGFIASEKGEMDGCANLSTLSSTRFSWNSLRIFSEVIDANVMAG